MVVSFFMPLKTRKFPMKKKYLWLSSLLLVGIFVVSFDMPLKLVGGNDPISREDSANILPIDSVTSPIKLYQSLELEAKGLAWETFSKALNGYNKLKQSGEIKKPFLSIVDMSQPSNKKRLYIIDMISKKLMINTLVAHGRNSGLAVASNFSNKLQSLQSSLGFYLTGDTYQGSNGYSMRLKGLEKGFNDLAEKRAIVMHGAPYVSETMAQHEGRIGRSWGCPAVSLQEHQQIINLIKDGSCLFVYAPQKQYLAHSTMVSGNAISASM